jgi:hypothetical protein
VEGKRVSRRRCGDDFGDVEEPALRASPQGLDLEPILVVVRDT